VQRALPGLPAQWVPLVLRVLLAKLDHKEPQVHRDLKATPVLPAPLERQAQLARWGLLAQLDRPVRKVPWALPARPEDLLAGRSFRAAACSWCQLESRG